MYGMHKGQEGCVRARQNHGTAGNHEASGFVNKCCYIRGAGSIHKAASLTVPGCSMILPGAIPETPISCECRPAGGWNEVFVPPEGSFQLCE